MKIVSWLKRYFSQPEVSQTSTPIIPEKMNEVIPIEGRHYQNSNYDRWKHFRNTGFRPNTFSHTDKDILLIENPPVATQLPMPPPALMEYREDEKAHLKSGLRDFGYIKNILEKNNISIENFKEVLEFGCSNGRVLRHFEPHTTQGNYWGCDINADQIMWNIENLSPPFRFFVNTTSPHLPIEDGTFSFIYCYSIFTHIDDLFVTWLLELRRIIQTSGYLFVSIHDENSVKVGLAEPNRLIHKFIKKNEEVFEKLLAGELNFAAINRDFNSQVFFRRAYFVKLCEQYFEVVDFIEYTMGGHQTGFLLKKKCDYSAIKVAD